MQYHISDNIKTMKGSAIREMFKTMAKPGIISFAGGNPSPLTFPVEEIKEMIYSGRMTDAKTISAIMSYSDKYLK